MRTSALGLVMLALAFVSAPPGRAQEPKHYSLPATPENVQWGWYDPTEKPKLVINSGDTVSIETLSHALGQGH